MLGGESARIKLDRELKEQKVNKKKVSDVEKRYTTTSISQRNHITAKSNTLVQPDELDRDSK